MHQLLFSIAFLSYVCFAFGQNEESLKQINGTKLYTKSMGSGTAILVVHGGPSLNHSYFKPHLNGLTKHNQVIYFDQRASGKSDITAPDSISLSAFVGDIEAIRKYYKKDKLIILAHSWGIIPAVSYAIQFPQQVQGLIFCNAVPLNKEFESEIAKKQLAKSTGVDSTDRTIIIGSPDFKAGKASAYKKLMLLSFRNSFHSGSNFKKLSLEMPDNYKDASRALFTGLSKDLAQYDFYENVKNFSFPILILHGEADTVPVAADQKVVDEAKNATLEVFKKSGHFIFIEENRKFISVVQKFANQN